MKYKEIKKIAYNYPTVNSDKLKINALYYSTVSYNNLLELGKILVKYRKVRSSHHVMIILEKVLQKFNLTFLEVMLITQKYYNNKYIL
uniref:hypothetical protein n=1 Tax=Pulvinaster venetus TaxID=427767 RepID=UPI001FCCD6B5|nr:hypothetical protein MW436_pgp171 [Pulvinaster venetus]UNJ16888.1 hypothetical protein [Pulvinaster venetus]